jgi:hypothetical protein
VQVQVQLMLSVEQAAKHVRACIFPLEACFCFSKVVIQRSFVPVKLKD